MSINIQVYRVFASEFDALTKLTENQLEILLFGQEGGTGWVMEPGRMIDLEKAYDAVDYVITGDSSPPVASFLLGGGDETIDYEFTYGPGRIFAPARTATIAAELSGLSRETIDARLNDTAVMVERYPFDGRYDANDREWVAGAFEKLRRFVLSAADSGCGLLVGSS
ncbi:DUF1877 family protein [Pendulispora albinea]|uniref:YfbM family protein n=1 Tax=Pendulispora albinea TaxID=2741071 RepID=A0ABZ2MAM9_9BACT